MTLKKKKKYPGNNSPSSVPSFLGTCDESSRMFGKLNPRRCNGVVERRRSCDRPVAFRQNTGKEGREKESPNRLTVAEVDVT